MAIAVVCPKCGKKYQVPENRAGQKGKCRCGSMIQVPRVAQPAASDDPSRKAAERQQAAIPPSETRAQVPMAGQSRRKPVGPAPASPSTESRPAGGPQNPPGTSPSTPPIEEPIVAEVVEEPVAKKMAVAPSDTASKRPAPSQKTKENARTEESLRILVKLGNPQEVGICLTLFKYGRGLDIDSKGSDGCTALHIASMEGHVDIVRMLLKAGANPNAKADVRITPLHAAVLRGHTQVIEVLLAGGAFIGDDWYFIRCAFHRFNDEVVYRLVLAGAPCRKDHQRFGHIVGIDVSGFFQWFRIAVARIGFGGGERRKAELFPCIMKIDVFHLCNGIAFQMHFQFCHHTDKFYLILAVRPERKRRFNGSAFGDGLFLIHARHGKSFGFGGIQIQSGIQILQFLHVSFHRSSGGDILKLFLDFRGESF